MMVLFNIKERNTLRCAEPFVASTSIKITVQATYIKRYVTRNCAPSIIVSIPALLANLHISSTGKNQAVELVIWEMNMTRVFLFTPDQNSLKIFSLVVTGFETGCCLILARSFLQKARQERTNAPYSCWVIKISSPAENFKTIDHIAHGRGGVLGKNKRSSPFNSGISLFPLVLLLDSGKLHGS
ncbi:MAG: hypothetical protein Ct9H300mP9_6970 [Candidatus Neomarinimicrobiota bacterium]|nr:MAG: hypothetical protein Ct9H300mP9_6970 [Candidatus Neomarinimicrobiota bacterium]